MTQQFDLGIIGGGPAGYTSALQARTKGLSVVMFEKDKVGGVCLNRGCIPTKTILHSAEVFEDLKCAENLGILADNISFDFEKVMERKDKTVEKIRKGLELALKNSGVVTVNAEAFFKNKKSCHTKLDSRSINEDYQILIEANNEVYECKKVIYAGGSSPRGLKGIDFDHEFILNSDDVLNMKKLPKSIVIIGSGAIGIEWARIFSAFNVEVSIIEAAEHLLPIADIEVSKRIERIFKAKKIKMYLGNGVEKIESSHCELPNAISTIEIEQNLSRHCEEQSDVAISSNGYKKRKVYLKSGEILEPDCVLLAVGRKPNVDEEIDGVTYLGDSCGKIQLAHFAIKQAVAEIQNIEFDESLVPSVVYGNPEIAWVGKREQDLEPNSYKKANLLVSALGKSHCDDASEGFIKILSQNDQIIGAHIVSKEASALIQQVVIAMQNNVSVDKLKEVCFAHPTYSEGIFECLFKL